MSLSDIDRLRDVLSHSRHARSLVETSTTPELEADPIRLRALLYDLIVIGTTIGKVSDAVIARQPDLPRRAVIDTRNRLIHAYWQIDLSFIARVAEVDLPILEAAVERLIGRLELEGIA